MLQHKNMINKVINGLSLVGESVKKPYCVDISVISNDRIISHCPHLRCKWIPFSNLICLTIVFEELIIVELKSPLYFECLILSHVLRIRNTK